MENNNAKKGFASHPENINKNGRPKKGHAMTDILNRLGDIKADGEDITKKEALALVMWEQALGGDIAFIKAVIAYTDGMPKTFANIKTDNPMMDRIFEAVKKGIVEDE